MWTPISFCSQLCSSENTSSCPNPPVYFCVFNLGAIMTLCAIFILITVFRFFSHRKRLSRNIFKAGYQQSIFSYLENGYFYKSYILYLLIAYGIFLFRPIGSVILNVIMLNMTNSSTKTVIVVTGNSVVNTCYFFTVIFMANFYAVKAEILRSKGDPCISAGEREFFLKMVIRRSAQFSLIFFCGSLLSIVFQNNPFNVDINGESDRRYEWTLRTISYIFTILVIINRWQYVDYAQKMVQFRITWKNHFYNIVSFSKHIKDNLIAPDMLSDFVDRMDTQQEQAFLQEFDQKIEKSCRESSSLFEERAKALHDSKSFYQPILRNPMENHLVGTIWLFTTLIDAFINAVLSLTLLIYEVFNLDNESRILKYLILVFYVIETVFQSGLAHFVVKNKRNYGDYLEVESSRSESSEFEGRISQFTGGDVLETFRVDARKNRQSEPSFPGEENLLRSQLLDNNSTEYLKED